MMEFHKCLKPTDRKIFNDFHPKFMKIPKKQQKYQIQYQKTKVFLPPKKGENKSNKPSVKTAKYRERPVREGDDKHMFLTDFAVWLYNKLRDEEDYSIHGAVCIIGLTANEGSKDKKWGARRNKNMYGLKSDDKLLDYGGDDEKAHAAWNETMAKFPDALKILKSENFINSDDINYHTNSGHYLHNGPSYNADDDKGYPKAAPPKPFETTMIKYKGKETGRNNYGRGMIWEMGKAVMSRWPSALKIEINKISEEISAEFKS